MKSIVKFWTRMSLKEPPFVHPDDRGALLEHSKSKSSDPLFLSFRQFVSGPRFGAFSDYRLHFSLLPVPYAGDISRAEIFVLQLNPGLNLTDYYAEFSVPKFRRRLEFNLRQQLRNTEFPFLYLDPDFCWHSGFAWWEGKFREVTIRIAEEKFGGRYLDALRDLSTRVASIELVPYHSISFAEHRAVQHLESARQARAFACYELTRRAASRKAVVIITRRVEDWNVPQQKGIVPSARSLARGQSGIEHAGWKSDLGAIWDSSLSLYDPKMPELETMPEPIVG